jgi:VWFA-related protein
MNHKYNTLTVTKWRYSMQCRFFKKNNSYRVFPILIAAVVCCWLLMPVPVSANDAEQDSITHKVSVDVMLVPIFVVSPEGEPVYDLKKEDFELYANGIPIQISEFVQFNFENKQEVSEVVKVKAREMEAKQPERAVFIVIDSVFNSFFGYRRSKEIADDIIKNGSPGDMFIVMENRAGGGLRHIAGPDENRDNIIKEIDKLKLPSGNWDRNLNLTREWNILSDSNFYDPTEISAQLENLTNKSRFMEQNAYKNQVQHFSDFLVQFKYALKTITRPKVVFLISEGIDKAAFRILQEPEKVPTYDKSTSALTKGEETVDKRKDFQDSRLFKDLQEIVKAMNEGGSVLYTINPGRIREDEEASGEMSLKFLATESGGQYIAGVDTTKIIKKVKTTTAAYYELAFTPTPDMSREITIDVKCKRPGIKVNSFRKTERTKPYYRMDIVEKKLFALNTVTGGSWSRIVGKVVRIKYRSLRDEKQGNEVISLLEIPLPPKMKGRELDLFYVQIDPQTGKANIELLTQTLKDRANIIVRKRENKKDFFVIIEPVFTYCIYNQV